jgi:hypothetical protein
MPNPSETDLTEVVELLITLYARQAALLKLVQYQNIAGTGKIEEVLRDADQRIRKLPVVQEVLAKKRLPPPGSLSRSLTGFPWDV